MHESYHHLPVIEVPLFPYEICGAARLAEVEKVLFPE